MGFGVLCNGEESARNMGSYTVEDLKNSKIALKGGLTKKYCADDAGGIICNRDTIGNVYNRRFKRW